MKTVHKNLWAVVDEAGVPLVLCCSREEARLEQKDIKLRGHEAKIAKYAFEKVAR